MSPSQLWVPSFAVLLFAASGGCTGVDDPHCEGDYTVDATDTAGDMALIANCIEITGSLSFDWTSLENLDGLSNLTEIGEHLYIGDNISLTDVDGLSNLTSVGGYLHIYYNLALTNVDGLSNLASVGGSLSITANPVLCQASIDAFVATCTVGEWVSAYGNHNGC